MQVITHSHLICALIQTQVTVAELIDCGHHLHVLFVVHFVLV
jgi:hypothetical protein